MSLRVLKKLKNQQISKPQESQINEENDSNEEEEVTVTPKNPFDLLGEEELQNSDREESNDETNANKIQAPETKKSSKSKKKKGKKTQQQQKSDEFNFISDSNDIEAYLNQNINNLKISEEEMRAKSILQIEPKYLNAENELKRMFGARIVNAEKAKRDHKKFLITKNVSIVSLKPNWPKYLKNGLVMRILNETQNLIEFTFEHLQEYQKIQFEFVSAVESLDHNNIINVLHLSPYHIDSLIQLSEVFKMSEDTNMAADFIERGIYAFQNSIHPSFSIQKQNYKIDYRRVENRGFFVCLFKHINFIGGKACYRTSLELCKFLFSLDIESDPLGAILMIDFYALRSHQYKFLIDFFECYNEKKQLNYLPNILFSVAVAHFHYAKDTNNEKHEKEANRLLKEALIKFPGILLKLLDKCNVQPDKMIENNWIFARHSHLNTPEGLENLFNLYIARIYYEWKIPEVMEWLEGVLKEMIVEQELLKDQIEQYKSKFKSIFTKVPSNVLRHIILSDSKEFALSLPRDLSSTDTYPFDPIPPKNSIVSYTLPERPQPRLAYANEDSILTFIRSLLPTFNSQERVEGAAGGEVAEDVNGIARIRELANQLRNIFNFNNENNPENNENEENYYQDNEFD